MAMIHGWETGDEGVMVVVIMLGLHVIFSFMLFRDSYGYWQGIMSITGKIHEHVSLMYGPKSKCKLVLCGYAKGDYMIFLTVTNN